MSLEEWEKLGKDKAADVLQQVNPFIDPVPLDLDATSVRVQNFDFYPGYGFYELTDFSAAPALRKYALVKPGDVNVITWTNQTIYEVNDKAPITLNEFNITDYVKFFFSYVRGRHGRFLVIEKVDDIRWQAEPPAQGRKVLQEMLHPVVLLNRDADGTFSLETFMIFRDSLFKTKIHVKKDGLVSMSDEELKIEGMPIIPDPVTV